MAIASLDQLTAGMIHKPFVYGKDGSANEASGISHTPWYGTGITGAGAAPSGGLNGANFVGPSVAGQIATPAAVTNMVSYLSRFSAVHNGGIGHVWLVDRLWGNVPVVTTTTSQAITQPTLPSRDDTASTNGAGVFLALEVSATTGNAGAITNTTASYTNSAGTAGRTATLASFPITGLQGTWLPFAMQAGDVGVRSVQSITLGTSYVSGAVHLVAWRLISEIETPVANVGYSKNFTSLNMPAVWDAAVAQLVYFTVGTSCGSHSGSLWFSQG